MHIYIFSFELLNYNRFISLMELYKLKMASELASRNAYPRVLVE